VNEIVGGTLTAVFARPTNGVLGLQTEQPIQEPVVKTLTGSCHGLFAALGHNGVISVVAGLVARVGANLGNHSFETLCLGRLAHPLTGTVDMAGRYRQHQDCSLFLHRASIAPLGDSPTSSWLLWLLG
jgi:hypothetical protein